jgi:lipopolysaccharide transport system permease protein
MMDDKAHEWTVMAKRAGLRYYFREFWSYRRLMGFLATKILEKQYQRSILGKLWLFIRPAMVVLMYTVLFGGVLGVDSGPLPFVLFLILGMTVWSTFDRALTWSTRSMETVRGIIKKVYFPKLLLPVAGQATGLFDLVVFSIYLLLAFLYFRLFKQQAVFSFAWELLAAPLAVALAVYFSLAISLWTSVLDALSRDMRYSLRYFMQVWMFFTPVVYPSERIPEKLRLLIDLNPMTALVENFRAALVPHAVVSWIAFLYPFLASSVILAGGLWFFLSFESETVDSL